MEHDLLLKYHNSGKTSKGHPESWICLIFFYKNILKYQLK